MEKEEHMSNNSSDDESDHAPSDKFSGNNAGVGRSYECTFCKRGFTNAQALGGHMNIHRKDKLKAKQTIKPQKSSLSSGNSNNTPGGHEAYTQISSQQQQGFYYSSSRAYLNYHQFYSPSSNPSYQQAVGFDPHQGYYRNFSLHQGFEGANLGLDDDEEERKEYMELSEVDLELRLGPNSTYQ